MKIEKLTEDKIRVVLNFRDMELDRNNFFDSMTSSQSIFVDILEKAEKEVNFHTEGCKLLIEAFSTSEDIVVFTITKFSTNDTNSNKKKVAVRRKNSTPLFDNAIYEFDNFDVFCDFCKSISNILDINIDKIAKKVLLYSYEDRFYLFLRSINYNDKNVHKVFNNLSEFAKIKNFSDNFEFKLSEHGKLFIKNNAILKSIKYLI